MKLVMVTHPIQSRSQLKIRQILAAAKQELIENGYQNFTTNHVASTAKCNIGTVYRYFSSKDEIITALYGEWLAEINNKAFDVIERLENSTDLAELIAQLFAAFCINNDIEHRLAIELTKAETMNSRLEQSTEKHDTQIRLKIAAMIEKKTGQTLAETKAAYLQNLMLSMMLMVSLASPEERPFYIKKSSEVLVMLVKSWEKA